MRNKTSRLEELFVNIVREEVSNMYHILDGLSQFADEEVNHYSHLGSDFGSTSHHNDVVFHYFWYLIGSRIGDMNGFSYMEYIVPGLIMMSVILTLIQMSHHHFSVLNSKNIEELAAPVPNYVVILGFVMGGGTGLTGELL